MIYVGCDPELFIWDGMDYIPACGLVPGTRENPEKVRGGSVNANGLAFEFHTEPANKEEDWEKNIIAVLNAMEDIVHDINNKYQVVAHSWVKFHPSRFDKVSYDNKAIDDEAVFSDYGTEKHLIYNYKNELYRVGNGHVHLGWTDAKDEDDDSHFVECMGIATRYKWQELFIPKTFLEKKRYKLLSCGGTFRAKHYGVELRAPSNFWVGTEHNRRKMFRIIQNLFTLNESEKRIG